MEFLIAFVAALGIPSAITGFLFKRLEKKLDQREKERQEKEKVREQSEYMMVKSIGAAIALGEATARAVQRIQTQSAMVICTPLYNTQRA